MDSTYPKTYRQATKIFTSITRNKKILKNNFESYKNKWLGTNWNVYIINFNYTKTIERLLGFENESKVIGRHGRESLPVYLRDIHHIHGTVDEGMVLGVNDDSQFLNEALIQDRLLKNKHIKSNYNIARRTGHDDQCQQLIGNADLICTFGISFGVTDLRWWKYVGDRLTQTQIRLIIFIYDKNVDLSEYDAPEILEVEEIRKDEFFDLVGIDINVRNNVRERIHVVINSNMFAIKNDAFTYDTNWHKASEEKWQ